MDLRLQPGFLGTGASLMADLTLVAYILLVLPAMLIGFYFARRQMFVPHHRAMMTLIVLINWAVILFLMIASYSQAVAPSVPGRLGEPPFLFPSIHLLFGATAQILATILLIRMWFEYRLPAWARFEPIKRYMRLTLALWIITVVLGVVTYVTWYGVPFTGGPAEADVIAPVATEDAAPVATEDAAPAPAATEDSGSDNENANSNENDNDEGDDD
jgi:uncharacterized membrane protein YozB (DUF420 family)